MTDKPSNHEPDDELLSAYLDGELSADERAAVEARLAADPGAQQLLHELRSVSQSVQAMPTESVGRDLSEDIIRRAREAAPVLVKPRSSNAAAALESSRLVDAMPKIRVFSSKRAWIWAAMTLAAGLLVMFVQSSNESAKKKLPPVAERDRGEIQNQPAEETGQSRRREISISAAPKESSPAPTIVASDSADRKKVDALGGALPATPMGGDAADQFGAITRNGAPAASPIAAGSSAPKPQEQNENTATIAASDSKAVTVLPSQVAADGIAAPSPSGQISSSGSALGIAAEKQKSESAGGAGAQPFIVVRVVAKPAVLKNGSFDRLLADNKIEFVPEPAKNEPGGFGGGKLLKAAKTEIAAKGQQVNRSDEGRAIDMVLVEASAAAIEACLADLNKNANDFVSVDVREESASHDRFDAKLTPTKKLAEETEKNLARFSRGNVPATQKDFDPRLYFYSHELAKPNDSPVNGSPRAGGAGPGGPAGADLPGFKHDANGSLALNDKIQPSPDIRRARGIESGGESNRQLAGPASTGGRAAPADTGAQGAKQPMSQRKPTEDAEGKANGQDNTNWKVLFIFTTDETPAHSVPSDNRTK